MSFCSSRGNSLVPRVLSRVPANQLLQDGSEVSKVHYRRTGHCRLREASDKWLQNVQELTDLGWGAKSALLIVGEKKKVNFLLTRINEVV